MEKTITLNEKDKKILYMLTENCRLTMREIGRYTKLSREVVEYRIKQLIKKGIISNFSIVLSNARLGFSAYIINLELQSYTKKDYEKLTKFLKELGAIKHFDKCMGSWDISLSAVVRNRRQLSRIIDGLFENFSDIIRNYDILIPVKPLKYKSFYFLKPTRYEFQDFKTDITGYKPTIEDRKIIEALSNNSRAKLVDLTKKSKLSMETISSRISKLKKEGILKRFKANIDVKKLGLLKYTLFLKIKNFSSKLDREMIAFLRKQEKVLYAQRIIGKYDLMMDIASKDIFEFEKQLNNLIYYFNKDLQHYSFAMIIEGTTNSVYPKIMRYAPIK